MRKRMILSIFISIFPLSGCSGVASSAFSASSSLESSVKTTVTAEEYESFRTMIYASNYTLEVIDSICVDSDGNREETSYTMIEEKFDEANKRYSFLERKNSTGVMCYTAYIWEEASRNYIYCEAYGYGSDYFTWMIGHSVLLPINYTDFPYYEELTYREENFSYEWYESGDDYCLSYSYFFEDNNITRIIYKEANINGSFTTTYKITNVGTTVIDVPPEYRL